ncbi:hypothetical protein CEXT_478491 [Caerostris extrusa]|uniref:Uncharacterized protein n=1 Tax=Caerostris extrusa TaxID=172846 RepID=A0AAV4Y1C4_CAEEX|nr:hypothetical protein CEXT_478491 [Caerostris extrusa]
MAGGPVSVGIDFLLLKHSFRLRKGPPPRFVFTLRALTVGAPSGRRFRDKRNFTSWKFVNLTPTWRGVSLYQHLAKLELNYNLMKLFARKQCFCFLVATIV